MFFNTIKDTIIYHNNTSLFLIISRRAKGPGREILKRPRLSVRHVSFSHCTSKTHFAYFLKTLQVRVPCHGGVLYPLLQSLIIPGVCLTQFSLNNVHKRGLKHHHFISFLTEIEMNTDPGFCRPIFYLSPQIE